MGQISLKNKTKWSLSSEKSVVPNGLPCVVRWGLVQTHRLPPPQPRAPWTWPRLHATPLPPTLSRARPITCIHAFWRAPREAPEPVGQRPSQTRPHLPRSRWRGSCSLAAWHPAHLEKGLRLDGWAQRRRPLNTGMRASAPICAACSHLALKSKTVAWVTSCDRERLWMTLHWLWRSVPLVSLLHL